MRLVIFFSIYSKMYQKKRVIYEFIKKFKSLIREELPSKNTDELLQKMNTLKDQLNDQYKLSVYRANQLIAIIFEMVYIYKSSFIPHCSK